MQAFANNTPCVVPFEWGLLICSGMPADELWRRARYEQFRLDGPTGTFISDAHPSLAPAVLQAIGISPRLETD